MHRHVVSPCGDFLIILCFYIWHKSPEAIFVRNLVGENVHHHPLLLGPVSWHTERSINMSILNLELRGTSPQSPIMGIVIDILILRGPTSTMEKIEASVWNTSRIQRAIVWVLPIPEGRRARKAELESN